MNRRTFIKVLGIGTISGVSGLGSFARTGVLRDEREGRNVRWPTDTYRRLLVDMHIPDSDPVLLSRFDPEEYVRTIADAGFEALLTDAQSEVGLCLYPTKVGQMHGALKGRDFVGEVVAQCRRRGMHVLAYISLMTDNWAYQTHPDWRFLWEEGYDRTLEAPRPEDRYPQTIPAGEVCPNSPYRDYIIARIKEFVSNYDLDGIWLDQLFWPGVCYCPHCTARFWREHKSEPPRIVDWDDPAWRQYQKMRQQSLLDLALEIYRTTKQIRPMTVCFNNAAAFQGWYTGVPFELNEAADYTSGDFYDGPEQYSLICKTFDSLTKTHPYEFMQSAPFDLTKRLSLKPFEELRMESLIPALHSAPIIQLDGIIPDGTLYKPLYEIFAKLNAELARYEPFLGGNLLADVAVYFDKDSMYNPRETGVHVSQLKPVAEIPHVDAVVGIAKILRGAHIPFGVVTNATLKQLSKYRAVVLPNVLELTSEQAAQFRAFVEQGGILYASGPSSLDRFDSRGPRFLLEDVLGVRYVGTLGTVVTYFTPKDDKVKEALWPQPYIVFDGSMLKVEALPGAEVLATVTLPFLPVESEHVIGDHYADIEGVPPALTSGSEPALVQHSFGKGRALWFAAPLETNPESLRWTSQGGKTGVNAKLVVSVLRRVLPGPYYFEADTHPSVEMTLFHQPEKKRLLAGLLNMQHEIPQIPVGATVRVQVPSGRRVTRVVSIPEQKAIPFEKAGAYTQFRLRPFDEFAMTLVEYE